MELRSLFEREVLSVRWVLGGWVGVVCWIPWIYFSSSFLEKNEGLGVGISAPKKPWDSNPGGDWNPGILGRRGRVYPNLYLLYLNQESGSHWSPRVDDFRCLDESGASI